MKIAIIDYGAGNVQSVLFAIERLGYTAFITNDAEKIKSADKVIFPGVGEASSAMQKIKAIQLDKIIRDLQQPVLGICLGMQLLCKSSEEGNTEGLGIFDIHIERFTNSLKVPQIGWNTVYDLKSKLFKGISNKEFMYLVHSFYAPMNEECIATTFYGMEYASAIQKDNFYGVQFHPEKSGATGAKILQNFLEL